MMLMMLMVPGKREALATRVAMESIVTVLDMVDTVEAIEATVDMDIVVDTMHGGCRHSKYGGYGRYGGYGKYGKHGGYGKKY